MVFSFGTWFSLPLFLPPSLFPYLPSLLLRMITVFFQYKWPQCPLRSLHFNLAHFILRINSNTLVMSPCNLFYFILFLASNFEQDWEDKAWLSMSVLWNLSVTCLRFRIGTWWQHAECFPYWYQIRHCWVSDCGWDGCCRTDSPHTFNLTSLV